MAAFLADYEIDGLIHETKPLQSDWRRKFKTKAKHGHRERELDIAGSNGSQFRIVLRESNSNPLGFSVILAFIPSTTNQIFRLRRYNGKDHEHTNRLEKQSFYDFHIHEATARYQLSGLREDAFAEPTNRFSNFDSAVICMLRDCTFALPDEPQSVIPGLEW